MAIGARGVPVDSGCRPGHRGEGPWDIRGRTRTGQRWPNGRRGQPRHAGGGKSFSGIDRSHHNVTTS